jgi:hypothetical protein
MRAEQDKEILGEVGTALHSDLGYAADAFPAAFLTNQTIQIKFKSNQVNSNQIKAFSNQIV